jgi:hypothetical protein
VVEPEPVVKPIIPTCVNDVFVYWLRSYRLNTKNAVPTKTILYNMSELSRLLVQGFPYYVPSPPEVRRIESELAGIAPFPKFVVSKTGDPDIQHDFGRRDGCETSPDEYQVIQAQENRKEESLVNL